MWPPGGPSFWWTTVRTAILQLGVRNLKGVTLMPTRDVNPYHLLGHQNVLLSEAAARKFSEALAK